MFRLALLLLVATASSSYTEAKPVFRSAVMDSEEFNSQALAAEFESWAVEHDKGYDSVDETTERMKIWKKNHDRIMAHNNQIPTPSFTLGHNEFSDMTQEEFQAHFSLGPHGTVKDGILKTAASKETTEQVLEAMSELELPDYVNWVQMGAVTPIKNQGACGSCWAFSTTGALEGAKAIKTGELVSLSEQNLIDCDKVDLGCMGGLMDNAFKFDEKSGGLCSEEDYPYKAKQGKCDTTCTDVPGSIVKTFVDVPAGDEKGLLSAIAMQPISVAIQADQFVFQFYKTGVLEDDSCGRSAQIDHGVLAVGYGTDLETQKPYWLVKNSWGETWGETGYVKLSRSSKNDYGMCAILRMASFPVVK